MIQIFKDYEINKESTFKIGGKVKEAAFPETVSDLIELLKTNEYDIVLGGCSNILFCSEYINKKIIITKNIKDYVIKGTNITVSCGVKGPLLSKECKEQNLTGFEFLIGFPGTFGGMISMNASAHNQSISDNFESAALFDLKDKQIITLNKEQMEFGYRTSKLSKGRYILLNAEFNLKRGNKEQIDEIMNRNIEFRKTRQPSLSYGNAGSIFKNPDNDSAGRLLDLCNLKGEKEGGAMVFENHANFIINYNKATSNDVLKLMYRMYSKVREKYRIILKPEIKYIGNRDTEEYKIWEIMTK